MKNALIFFIIWLEESRPMRADIGYIEAGSWGERLRTHGAHRLMLGLLLAVSLLVGLPAHANAESPGVTTEAAAEVTTSGAILQGSVNPHGFETTYQFEYGITTAYGSSVPIAGKGVGAGTSAVKATETLSNLQAGTTYYFRITAKSAEGSSFGKAESFATKTDPRFLFDFGTQGSGGGQFQNPQDVAIGSSSNVLVADSQNNRIQVFDSKGEYLSKFGVVGTEDGELLSPYGIATDAAGNIWVADTGNDRIQKFNAKGEFLFKFGTLGEGKGEFLYPYDVAVDSAGNVWAVDSETFLIQKFNPEGKYLTQFGGEGSGNGQFSVPTGITVDAKDDVYVIDSGNCRVQKFNSKGEYLSQFGALGEKNGQFFEPMNIDVGPEGNAWVTDLIHPVQQFNSKGEYQDKFGTIGTGKSQFELYFSGLAMDSEGDLWVADTGNFRVQKWNP